MVSELKCRPPDRAVRRNNWKSTRSDISYARNTNLCVLVTTGFKERQDLTETHFKIFEGLLTSQCEITPLTLCIPATEPPNLLAKILLPFTNGVRRT